MVFAVFAVAVLAGSWGLSRYTDLGSRFPPTRLTATSTAAVEPGVKSADAIPVDDPLPAGTAAAALAGLAVKGRAPKTGYTRDQFGPAWADETATGCDTRNEILQRDLTATVLPGAGGCAVAAGTLDDPYSGRLEQFTRGRMTSGDIQIDHVVALSNAWQTGAAQWTPTRRRAYANDPLVLLAVDGRLNQQKKDGDAATWLPPNRTYRCTYVARQIAIKTVYGLWVTPAEKAAITAVLTGCPGQLLPIPAQVAVPGSPTGPGSTGTSGPASLGTTDPAVAGAAVVASGTASPTATEPGGCGAPVNPYGYTYCGTGTCVYTPAAGVCTWFSCIGYFAHGTGYLVQCHDGMVSMSGGHRGACSYHGGENQPVDH